MLIEAHANLGFLAVVESSDQTKTPSESTSQNIHAAMGTLLMNSQRLCVLFLNGANPSDCTNIKVWLQNLCISLTSVIADIQSFYFVDYITPRSRKRMLVNLPRGRFHMHQFTPPT